MSRSAGAIGIVIALVLILLVGAGLVVSWGWGGSYGWGMMGPGMTLAPALVPALRSGASAGASAGVGGWWGIPFLGPIFMLVLVGLTIGGLVWFIQAVARGGPQTGGGRPGVETPLEILKRRYASGEIAKEQFDDMRRAIDSQ